MRFQPKSRPPTRDLPPPSGEAASTRAGVPLFATHGRINLRGRPTDSSAEGAANRAADAWQQGESSIAVGTQNFSAQQGATARNIAQRANGGSPLPKHLQSTARQRYGIDHAVRVHTDGYAARLTRGLGANAVTAGNDIFFAEGKYAPETPAGEHLVAHELAHVAQQGGVAGAAQCDLAMSLGVTLGGFDVALKTMPKTATNSPGMSGTIQFWPDPLGPYSSEIGLIQAVNATDVGGASNPASGMPVDWSQIRDLNSGVVGGEAGRMELMTTGLDGAPQGWMVDSMTAATPRGSSTGPNGDIGPNYIEHYGIGGDNQFGWLRSPTDFGPASLRDFPQMSFDVDFEFETVAKGTDNQTVYGSLFWGFNIRSGAVQGGSEYAYAVDNASATFEEALERHRGYFVHEPVVLYFDTDVDTPIGGEDRKIADIPDYLTRYPDVNVSVWGYADERGTDAHNFDLAGRRAESVAQLLMRAGIPASRFATVFGIGETNEFSQHGTPLGSPQPVTPGRLRANRRVVISFGHTVSGYPLVMP